MAKTFTISKSERLKSRKQIDLLFKTGGKFHAGPFRVFHLLSSDAPGKLLVGVGAGTRHFKRAVDRNRIKRLTREGWRLQSVGLRDRVQASDRGLHVFFIYTGKVLPEHGEVFAAVKMAIGILSKMYHEKNPATT